MIVSEERVEFLADIIGKLAVYCDVSGLEQDEAMACFIAMGEYLQDCKRRGNPVFDNDEQEEEEGEILQAFLERALGTVQ